MEDNNKTATRIFFSWGYLSLGNQDRLIVRNTLSLNVRGGDRLWQWNDPETADADAKTALTDLRDALLKAYPITVPEAAVMEMECETAFPYKWRKGVATVDANDGITMWHVSRQRINVYLLVAETEEEHGIYSIDAASPFYSRALKALASVPGAPASFSDGKYPDEVEG